MTVLIPVYRLQIGKKLIDFDEEYSSLFSGEIPRGQPELAKLSEDELAEHFAQVQRRFVPVPSLLPHDLGTDSILITVTLRSQPASVSYTRTSLSRTPTRD